LITVGPKPLVEDCGFWEGREGGMTNKRPRESGHAPPGSYRSRLGASTDYGGYWNDAVGFWGEGEVRGGGPEVWGKRHGGRMHRGVGLGFVPPSRCRARREGEGSPTCLRHPTRHCRSGPEMGPRSAEKREIAVRGLLSLHVHTSNPNFKQISPSCEKILATQKSGHVLMIHMFW